MAAHIAIIQGHPDVRGERFGRALAGAYAAGAAQARCHVETIDVARLDFPVLRAREDWESERLPDDIRKAQETITRAEHLVIFYPLWLGAMPALLKAFLEQALRPGYAFNVGPSGAQWKKMLRGKSARIVVTMGMPAFIYRWYFGAHSLRSLERNILGFSGIGPIRETLIGNVEGCGAEKRARWLEQLHTLGTRGA